MLAGIEHRSSAERWSQDTLRHLARIGVEIGSHDSDGLIIFEVAQEGGQK